MTFLSTSSLCDQQQKLDQDSSLVSAGAGLEVFAWNISIFLETTTSVSVSVTDVITVRSYLLYGAAL